MSDSFFLVMDNGWVDLSELERLANNATLGPWRVGRWMPDEDLAEHEVIARRPNGRPYVILSGNQCHLPDAHANAAFVAMANPQVVLRLIEEVKGLHSDPCHPSFSKQLMTEISALRLATEMLTASLHAAQDEVKRLRGTEDGSHE